MALALVGIFGLNVYHNGQLWWLMDNLEAYMSSSGNPFAVARAETGGAALAASDEARGAAEVQGRMVIAKRFPRDPIKVMDRILDMCARPSLAESALYGYSRGGSEITGPSIRLAEAVAQQWGNIDFGFREVGRGVGSDQVGYSDVEAFAWDLESNSRRAVSFRVRHWRDTRQGGYPVKEERDIYELVANQAQRRVRACILGVIPGDVTEAAVDACDVTLAAHADTGPEAVKGIIEGFARFGVTREQIEARIQRRLESILPAQVLGLRKIYNSLRDGMSTASDWFSGAAAAAPVAESRKGAGTGTRTGPGAAPAGSGGADLPSLDAEQFAARLPKWRDLVESGRQTAEALIAMVSARNALTDEQVAALRALGASVAGGGEQEQNDDWLAGYAGEGE